MIGRRYDTGEAVELCVQDHTLIRIHSLPDDPTLPWIAPGFNDLQVNGYGGHAFNDPRLTEDHFYSIANSLQSQGVTCFLATCTTHSFASLEASLRNIAGICSAQHDFKHSIPGLHLEGPYISPHDGPRGAHPREHVRPPDWEEFRLLQDAAQDMIQLITLSPEYENAPQFIERAVATGVVVAIGHTNATSDQISAAVDAGATLSTHLGNGCHLQIKRHPNYLWDQLAEDRLCASLIADGHHLPPAVIKSFVRMKTPSRCIIVSDYTELAGCSPGRYRTSLGDVEMLPEGKLVVADQRELLAGAAQSLKVGLENVLRFAHVSLREAIDMVTANPCRAMGWDFAPFQLHANGDYILFHYQNGEISILP